MLDKGRRKQEVQQREVDAWRLRTRGLTQWQIASQLRISQPAVCKMLSRVGQRLAGEFLEEARVVKMQQTEILDQIAAEALLAWEKSKQNAETEVTVKGLTKGSGEGEKDTTRAQVTKTVTGQTGNPAHLAQARGALSDIRELWGLNAPSKQEHSGPGGMPIPVISEIVVELPGGTPSPPASEPFAGNGHATPASLEVVIDR